MLRVTGDAKYGENLVRPYTQIRILNRFLFGHLFLWTGASLLQRRSGSREPSPFRHFGLREPKPDRPAQVNRSFLGHVYFQAPNLLPFAGPAWASSDSGAWAGKFAEDFFHEPPCCTGVMPST